MIKLLAQRVFFQRPMFGFANLKEKMEKRQEKKQRDQYKEELEHLASKPQFTLIDMRQRAVDGLHKLKKGLKYKIASGNEETEQQLTLQKQILNAFFDEELLNPDLITATKKKEIAMVSQTKVEDVNKIIKQYEHMQNLSIQFQHISSVERPRFQLYYLSRIIYGKNPMLSIYHYWNTQQTQEYRRFDFRSMGDKYRSYTPFGGQSMQKLCSSSMFQNLVQNSQFIQIFFHNN